MSLLEGSAHALGSCLGSCARMRRKLGCGLSVRDCPLLVPASFSSSTPSGSSRGFSLSSTVAEHRLALSNSTHCPASMAFVSTPSIHSNLQTHDLSSEAAFSRETASHLYIRRQLLACLYSIGCSGTAAHVPDQVMDNSRARALAAPDIRFLDYITRSLKILGRQLVALGGPRHALMMQETAWVEPCN